MKGVKVLELANLGDERGELIVAEGNKVIPFDIKRVFYIYKTTKGTIRGLHANRESKFFFINVSGSCKIKVNDGITQDIITLDQPHKALYMDKMIWKEMYDFSEDAILIVISSEYYNGSEYIRDYAEFISEVTVSSK